MSSPGQIIRLLALVLSLGLDTLAVSVALGMGGLAGSNRRRAAFSFALFEGLMPLVGVALGKLTGAAIGRWASAVGILLLALVGAWMLVESFRSEETQRTIEGWRTLLISSLSVSMDELAVGFSLGLIGVPIGAAVILIALQAFVVTTIGLGLGHRLGSGLSEHAEAASGLVLLLLAGFLTLESVVGH
ncbi:MAG TPA: manganese efflux pump [Chloroflexota bacterium]|nr:manganese efflux pump [Chloroflexota bacterium]